MLPVILLKSNYSEVLYSIWQNIEHHDVANTRHAPVVFVCVLVPVNDAVFGSPRSLPYTVATFLMARERFWRFDVMWCNNKTYICTHARTWKTRVKENRITAQLCQNPFLSERSRINKRGLLWESTSLDMGQNFNDCKGLLSQNHGFFMDWCHFTALQCEWQKVGAVSLKAHT